MVKGHCAVRKTLRPLFSCCMSFSTSSYDENNNFRLGYVTVMDFLNPTVIEVLMENQYEHEFVHG